MSFVRRVVAALGTTAVLAVALVTLAPSVSGQASPCPPGQPDGRPPGTPPNEPGQPDGRPPEYPPGKCNLQLSQGSVARGEKVGVRGGGFVPGETVRFSLSSGQSLGSAVAGPDGAVVADVTIPVSAPTGTVDVRAAGEGQVLSANLEILDAAAAPAASSRGSENARGTQGLALTGVQVGGLAAAGAGLTGVGTAFVIAARRRRAAAPAA